MVSRFHGYLIKWDRSIINISYSTLNEYEVIIRHGRRSYFVLEQKLKKISSFYFIEKYCDSRYHNGWMMTYASETFLTFKAFVTQIILTLCMVGFMSILIIFCNSFKIFKCRFFYCSLSLLIS